MSKSQAVYSQPASNGYLLVPMLLFFVLLTVSMIRSPGLISYEGIGSAVIVVAPLILATYALTVIAMAGRAGVDLSMGPLLGFVNVGLIQLFAADYLQTPVSFFLYAIGVGIGYQVLMGLIIVFVRVQPIIVSLSGYLALVGLNLVILPRPGGVAPDWLTPWGAGTSIISPILVIIVLATIGWYVLSSTAFWGHLRMMGSDERAAYTSGVRINIVRIMAHAIAGIYAGLAAITFTALIGSGDPTQGTTYTLLAVTALVLGGTSLSGGRGGAFGSLLGALNIYLITYVLATFNFGGVQSFVTDLSYGVILVLSLLVSIALPTIQKRLKNISPVVLFAFMSCIALSVIVHTTLDKQIQTSAGSSALQSLSSLSALSESEGTSLTSLSALSEAEQAGKNIDEITPGTIVLFIVIGLALAMYLLKKLLQHKNAPMLGLTLVVIVVGLGLIFNSPNDSTEEAGADPVGDTPVEVAADERYSPPVVGFTTASATSFTAAFPYLSDFVKTMVLFIGIVLLGSLLVLTMLPQVSTRVKGTALYALAIGGVILALWIASQDFSAGAWMATHGGVELYLFTAVGLLLFITIAHFTQSGIKNITRIYIIVLCVVAFGSVYFLGGIGNTFGQLSTGIEYADLIFIAAQPQAVEGIVYAQPDIVESGTEIPTINQFAYAMLIIALAHLVLRHTALDKRIRNLREHWKVIVPASLGWAALFYMMGVPLWKIVIVFALGVLLAPVVWHVLAIYQNRRRMKPALDYNPARSNNP